MLQGLHLLVHEPATRLDMEDAYSGSLCRPVGVLSSIFPSEVVQRQYRLFHLPHGAWCSVNTEMRGRSNFHETRPVEERMTEQEGGFVFAEGDYAFTDDLKVLALCCMSRSYGCANAFESKGRVEFAVE